MLNLFGHRVKCFMKLAESLLEKREKLSTDRQSA